MHKLKNINDLIFRYYNNHKLLLLFVSLVKTIRVMLLEIWLY